MVYISRVRIKDQTWEIRATERGICGVLCGSTALQGEAHALCRQGAEELLAYLEGQRRSFSVPLDLSGTSFQMQVWRALTEVPYGCAVSYSEIARRIDRPDAVRAVAQAIGKNPCLVMVPCHRVLGKDGSLTGYSAGLQQKCMLLDLEQIPYRSEQKQEEKRNNQNADEIDRK